MRAILREHLRRVQGMKRHEAHPFLHELHKTHRISRKTLFYLKEYGPHSNIAGTIVKESLRMLLFASIISSFGGLALEHIKLIFISIVPLTILLPTLNDMIGDYGTIVAAHMSTMLHEGTVKKKWWQTPELWELFCKILIIALITATGSIAVAVAIAHFAHGAIAAMLAAKIFLVVILDVIILVSVLFLLSVTAGRHFYGKGEDPNNFLIPITTSVADFGNMVILAALVILLF